MSSVLDVVAATLQVRVKQYANLVENSNPVLRALKIGRQRANRYYAQGASIVKEWSGGTYIEMPIRYAAPANVQWYDSWDALSNTVNDGSAIARYEWKLAQMPIFFSGKELAINQGEARIVDLVKNRIEAAEQEFFNTLNKQLLSATPSSNQINSILTFITENNTAGVVGGLDRATNAWWRNMVFVLHATDASQSFDGKTGSLTSRIRQAFDAILRILARGDSGVDVILAGQTIYDAFLEHLVSTGRYDIGKEPVDADLGVGVLTYLGVPIIPLIGYDYSASTGINNPYPNYAFFINSRHLEFRVHPQRNFTLSDRIKLPDRDGEGYRVFFMGNLVASSLNHHGLLKWVAS